MKLSYWVAMRTDDHRCYSLRAKTKKEVEDMLANGDYDPSNFEAPKKVTVYYTNGFDLMMQCMGSEGSGWWED